ncbi:hypothetical protein [Halorussus amylolyticus]|uniref:hypothetical protein n=1 Tax=Halorussus amylolyticus TaxID=1126242 RepID=UPI0034A1B8F5
MPADDEGLTKKEQELFSQLVQCIKSNKEEVLDVLAGEETGSAPTTTDSTSGPDGAPSPSREVPADDPPALSEDVSAADVMGGGASETTAEASETESASADAPSADADDQRPAPDEAAAVAGGPDDEEDSDDERDPLAGLEERTTIRITRDVGEIFGVDERTYDLENEDVVTLPEENAGPLVEQGAAEKLE